MEVLWLLSAVGQTEPGCEGMGPWGLLTHGARAEDNAVLGQVCRTGSRGREINIRDKHLCLSVCPEDCREDPGKKQCQDCWIKLTGSPSQASHEVRNLRLGHT